MTMIASYNWESDSFTQHTATPAQVTFREAVLQVADKAKAVLPDNASRIDKAITLVLNRHIEMVDGHCRVMSQANGKTVYHQVNGVCTCMDFTQEKAPNGFCKHRLAHGCTLFRTFGECFAALPKMGEDIVGAYPAASDGLWVADVSRCASSPARGRRGESAVPSMRGAPREKAG